MRALTCRLCVLGLSLLQAGGATPYPDRLVWVFGWNLDRQQDVDSVVKLFENAAEAGLNGAVLSANLDTLCRQSPQYLEHLATVKREADRLKLELIPSVFSVGYGGGALAHNRQLAEGLPVVDAPFVVNGREAQFVPEKGPLLVNGDFENHRGDQFPGFGFHDMPGTISFADSNVVHAGHASIRLEHFDRDRYGHGRVMQKLSVKPHRCYRMSLWVKTEGLKPANAFRVTALAGDRELAPRTFEVPSTSDWRKVTLLINSLEFDSVNVYAGVWEGKGGRLWLDDWKMEEIGPINVLRRPGTPVTVRSADGTTNFQEGRDYAPLTDPDFNFYRVERMPPALKILSGGRITDGAQLRVSWYHPMVIHESQVTVCMAEPELYEIYKHEAELLAKTLSPKRVLLNMDEVRMGGTCRQCAGRDMAALLGQCITRQVESLRAAMPGVEVYIWSDMLDPNHNAHGKYYLVQGDFTGSWKHVPKDLKIAVWGGEPRPKSLEFFAKEGFETLIACYYDADTLEDVQGWMRAAQNVPGVRGFMYTPWLKKYSLLPQFGRMLQKAPSSTP